MVKKKHYLALTDPSITSAIRLYDRFPRERAGGGGGEGVEGAHNGSLSRAVPPRRKRSFRYPV